MQLRKANDRQRQGFERIARTLLALAALCERLGSVAPAIRFLVLCMLRPAEGIAREFVLGTALDAGLQPSEEIASLCVCDDQSPDAHLLACRFQALALILAYLMQHDLIVLASHGCDLRPWDVRILSAMPVS